jgi:hypothetical protein
MTSKAGATKEEITETKGVAQCGEIEGINDIMEIEKGFLDGRSYSDCGRR